MSTVKFNPKVKAGVIKERSSYNEQQYGYTELSNDQLKQMLRDISNLSKRSHWKLYKFVRDTKGKQHIKTTGSGTYFNFNRLDAPEMNRFYELVSYCVEDERRQKEMEQAETEHNRAMEELNNRLTG